MYPEKTKFTQKLQKPLRDLEMDTLTAPPDSDYAFDIPDFAKKPIKNEGMIVEITRNGKRKVEESIDTRWRSETMKKKIS